ncbi:MAG: hypothetical protein ACI92I_000958 [Acidimicrobiales bacterium]|jgi:hypothetical protein
MYRRPVQIAEGSVYCSFQCTGKDQRAEKTCKICSKKYCGAKVTCSRPCAHKSRVGIIHTKENKFNKAYKGTLLKEKVPQERGGVCERCGHNNYAILQIHHRKERHRDGADRITNLELLYPNCHASHHYGNALYTEK